MVDKSTQQSTIGLGKRSSQWLKQQIIVWKVVNLLSLTNRSKWCVYFPCGVKFERLEALQDEIVSLCSYPHSNVRGIYVHRVYIISVCFFLFWSKNSLKPLSWCVGRSLYMFTRQAARFKEQGDSLASTVCLLTNILLGNHNHSTDTKIYFMYRIAQNR